MVYSSYGGLGGYGAFPPVVKNLLIINGLVFLAQLAVNLPLIEWFALWPLGTRFQVYQLATYSFLHGGVSHILFNMFALWMFGAQIENTWGSRRFTIYYFACVIGAGFVQLAANYFSGASWPTIGASGGVFGILSCLWDDVPGATDYAPFSTDPDEGQVFCDWVWLTGAFFLLRPIFSQEWRT